MNWYNNLKIAQYYDEIKKEDYINEEDPDNIFNTSQYFSIGQNEETREKSYCWIWVDNRLYSKKGGTHGINFGNLISGHDVNDFNRGWFDPIQQLLSIVITDKKSRPPGIYKFNENDIPEDLNNALRNQFGYKFRYVVF